jgi:hypothetical protein
MPYALIESIEARRARCRRRSLVGLLLVGVACAFGNGCVQRRLTIRSNPPGATVYVDDHQIGTTPVSTEFTYYGTRRIKLIRDGYETLTTFQAIKAPWYQIPGIDFFAENMVGREIRDERILDFTMKPQKMVPASELMARANNLRTSARMGMVVPRPPQPGLVPVPVPAVRN